MNAVIGRGHVVSGGETTGRLRRANEIAEVFALLKDDRLDETILLVDSPSATAVVPLLAKVRGVVCLSGGPTSHLALVSREFGLPCLMGTELEATGDLEGHEVRLSADGTISAV